VSLALRAAPLLGTEDFQVRPNRLRVTPAACQLSFEYSNAVAPGVAGCLDNESLVRGEEAH
jgi:hypothetical protein